MYFLAIIFAFILCAQIDAKGKGVTPAPDNPLEVCKHIRCRDGYRCDCEEPCPKTCSNLKRESCPTKECNAGCVCQEGYVLSSDNVLATCVNKSDCPVVVVDVAPVQAPPPRPPLPSPPRPNPAPNATDCAAIQCPVGSQCGCMPECPLTCDNPQPLPCPIQPNCTVGCFTVCRSGWVLDRIGGVCIPLRKCPKPCLPTQTKNHRNEIYYGCSKPSECERTCAEPKPNCTAKCAGPGRFDCARGYVRDQRTGVCVLLAKCNKEIQCRGRYEMWFPCSTRKCQKTCQRPNPLCTALCEEPGNCDCMEPYVRDTTTCRCIHVNAQKCVKQRLQEFWYELY